MFHLKFRDTSETWMFIEAYFLITLVLPIEAYFLIIVVLSLLFLLQYEYMKSSF